MVCLPCTARICSMARCAAASRSFSIRSNAAMSGLAAHTGACVVSADVCASALKAAAENSATKPETHRKCLKLVVNDMISPRHLKSILETLYHTARERTAAASLTYHDASCAI